jgi:hypothetical protein
VNVRRSIVRVPVALTAATLALTLSSCGFEQPTDMVYNPAVGVNDQSGSVDVLNAVIVSGSDGSGTLVATFANNDPEQEATLAQVTAGGEDQVQVTLEGETAIDAGSLLNLLDEGGAQVEGEAVVPGAFITLTFLFDGAESATLDVPVVEHGEGPYEDVPVS